MRRVIRNLPAWIVFVLVACLPALAPAQEGPLSLELSFSNPGARSMGFGGAFVALADDATAAFANPAGLIQLTRPEVSIEGRLWSYSTPYTEGGRLSGQPTGIGLDTVPGLRTAEVSDDLSGVSFLSYVYPQKRWALAFYRHQLSSFESTSETQGFFADPPLPARSDDFRRIADFNFTTYAAALAFRASERLSLGVTLALVDSDAAFATERYEALGVTLPDGLYGRNIFHPDGLEETDLATLDATDLTLGLGALWRLSSRWSVGASYRQGAELAFIAEEISGPAFELPLPVGTVTGTQRGDLGLPDVFALGTAYRSPGGRFTVAFEWDRVEYATIVSSLGEGATGATLDDGDELHAGVEWVFPGRSVIALRAGAWLDPDHRVRFTDTGNELDRAIFRGGDDELHFALGAGIAFERFQVDVAADFSNLVDTVALSAIYSF